MNGGPGIAGRLHRRPSAAVLAAVVVLGLTAAALLAPDGSRGQRLLLVVDPLGQERAGRAFEPLGEALETALKTGLRLAVVRDLPALAQVDWREVAVVICPSAVAAGLSPERLLPLAAGVGQRPGALRSRPLLVRRRGAPEAEAPWRDRPGRTVVGDSLSLGLLGAVCAGGPAPAALAFGPDPYDHAPVLHALRLGCFDYAVVGEAAWDRFLAAGLLRPDEWERRDLGPAVPEPVILAARDLGAEQLLRLTDRMVRLGRADAPADERLREAAALRGLALIHVAGLQPLLEPELQRLRERHDPCWPKVRF